MDVIFNDKNRLPEEVSARILNAINEVIEKKAFILGEFVKDFEEKFARKLSVKNCIGVGNGTDALYAVLMMLGIGRGDEVFIPANSWISDSEAVTLTGATPVFIDNCPDNYNIDVTRIEDKITKYTKALLAVHQYGQPCHIDQIKNLCEKYDLYLIEDCSEAPFAKYGGLYAGTFGDAALFSFYPEYPLGAYGDSGAVVTNDDKLAKNIRMFTNHGQSDKYEHWMEGINSRLDAIQAAVLSIKLEYIDIWNQERVAISEKYNTLLKDVEDIILPVTSPDSMHVYKNYVIRAEKRDMLKDFLKMKGIETEIIYPVPLPFHQAYRHYRHKPGDFPNAFRNKEEILALPVYPGLTTEEIKLVAEEIKNFYLVQRI